MLEVTIDTLIHTFHLDLSFTADIGKTTVLLGESGAGKSTVLRSVAGLLHPQRGHISLDDVTYFDSDQHLIVPPQDRPFGYVFQDYVLFPHLSVFENVAFGLRAQHLPRKTIHQHVGEALEQVHLTGLDQRRPAQLSGGQQQRVAIARALALRPQLLLLDEPLSALDVQTRREVRQELRRLLTNVSVTTLMVTHQYLDALLFGQQILVLDQGKIIQQGNHHTLLQKPRSSYVAELVGMNFFQGRVVHSDANALCTIQLSGNGRQGIEVHATLGEYDQTRWVPQLGEDAYVVVDPRSITLHLIPPEGSAQNVFCGEIVQILPVGNAESDDGRVRVSILLNSSTLPLTAELTSSSTIRMELSEGKTIYASFKATEARAYE